MERKEYVVGWNNAEKSEKVLRDFLLKNADTVRFTSNTYSEGRENKIVKRCGDDDPKLNKLLKKLEKDFIKRTKVTKSFTKEEKELLGEEFLGEIGKVLTQEHAGYKKIEDTINPKKQLDFTQILKPYIKSGKQLFNYYYYMLSKNLKKMINKEGLFVGWGGGSPIFPCFRDPTFYRNNKMLADVVSHEPEVTLYLTIAEKEHLQRIGVVFGYPR